MTPLLPALALATSAWVSPASAAEGDLIDVTVGSSVIQREGRAIARVLISNPDIAELRLLEEGQYQVRGLAVGTTDLWVWYRGDEAKPRSFRVIVTNDLTDVQRRIAFVVKGEPPRVYPVRDRLVVEGAVDDLDTLERVAAIAGIYDKDFVNLLTVRGDHQVQLKVVFAEVSRTGMRQLGINLFGNVANAYGGLIGPGLNATSNARLYDVNAVPNINGGALKPPSSEGFNLVAMMTGAVNFTSMLSILEQNSLARTLAQPTLVSLSGQQAELLVGGEIPIAVAQAATRITIEYKEYGVKLVFVPTVLAGQVIDMRAYVEVSSLDPANATSVSGIEIPALISRKGKTHLRLEDGMTFAMAGILDERTTATRSAVPLLGDLPLVGAAFRFVKHERTETELVVFVTPQLVRPLAPGEVPPPPGTTENYNPNDFQLFVMGNLQSPGTRTAEPTGAFGMKR